MPLHNAVVIPAFNEESTIASVVSDALKIVDMVIVVDDCSTDTTGIMAHLAGAEVYKLVENRGAGWATRIGLELAQSADVIVTIDGDGQHNVGDIPKLINVIRDGYDFVIGSRFKGECKFPAYRKLGISVINLVVNFGHSWLSDTQCCLRAFKGSKVKDILPNEPRFGFSTEMLIKARKLGYKIGEVPVSCVYRDLHSDSSMNPIKHGVSVLTDTLKWRWRLKN